MKHPHPLDYAAPPKARPRLYPSRRQVWGTGAVGAALVVVSLPIVMAALTGHFSPAAAACLAFFLAGIVLAIFPEVALRVWQFFHFSVFDSYFQPAVEDIDWVLQALGLVLMALAAVVAYRAL